MRLSRKKIGCLGMAAMLLFCGCGIFPEEEELRTAPVISSMEEEYFRTEEVKTGDVVEQIQVYCYYQKQKSAEYGFPVVDRDTTLEGIYVKEGDKVKAGTVLAELGLGSLGVDLTEKQSAYDGLNKQIAYYEGLLELEKERQTLAKQYGREFDDGTLLSYEEQLDSLRDQLHIAELQLNEVKEQLGERQLVAEFDGIVTYVKRFDGWQWLHSGETVVTLESEEAGFICTTDQGEYFPEGAEVAVSTEVGVYDAKVTEVSPAAGEKVRLVMEVQNPDRKLVTPLKGTVSVVVASVENVTYIPYAALRKMGEQYAVYIQNKEGLREIRYVDVGLIVNSSLTAEENRVEIKSGVEPGETVIIR